MRNEVFVYNNAPVTFQLGNGDILVNATEMAKPFNKRPVDYLRLPSTNELIRAKVRKSHSDENQLVKTVNGGNNSGTWLHEDIALDFAQWLSVDFKLWCNDRIKELLRYGMTATPDTIEQLIANPDTLIQLAQQLKAERAEKERLAEQNELHKQQLEVSAPKVQYYNEVLQSGSTYNTNQIAKELGLSAVTLNARLQNLGVQYRQGGQWLLFSKYQDKGYTKTHTHSYTRSDGTTGTSMLTVWTERGREFVHRLLGV